MFCPKCGTNQSDELKFCKSCGANLFAVRQAVATRETGEKFDWSKTWVAEMFLSPAEQKRRKEENERLRGITPEVKRNTEIKAGVIVTSVGIAVTIFLFVFMQGVILSGKIPHDAVEILSRLWVAGVIPICVGIGLLINGLLVGRGAPLQPTQQTFEREHQHSALPSGDKVDFIPSSPSVTEGTTRELRGPDTKE